MRNHVHNEPMQTLKNGKEQWQIHYQNQMAIIHGFPNLQFQYIFMNPQLSSNNEQKKMTRLFPIYSNLKSMHIWEGYVQINLNRNAYQALHNWYGICGNMAWNMVLIRRAIRRPC